MKAITALVIMVALVLLATTGARAYIDHTTAIDAQAAHAARAVALDARLANACAKHQTGVVLFYKGQHCAQGSN